MNNEKNGLIIFIRNPELGKVKTRLAKAVGDEQALKIYKSLLNHTKNVVESVDCVRYLFYSEEINNQDSWSSSSFIKILQNGSELGSRMGNAFQELFDLGIEKAVIVGSDIAGLSSDIIQASFDQLNQTDFVMGKALDGGYYLLGMKNPTPYLFREMIWSTSTVAQETIDKIDKLSKTVSFVETLSDIDYIEDWNKWGWEV